MYDPPNVEMKVINGAAFVKMNLPTTSKTHSKYCDIELKAKILQIADTLQRLDCVRHLRTKYYKGDTRDGRGKSIRFSVRQDTPVY